MTIRKGENWGATVAFPDGVPILADDAALFARLNPVDDTGAPGAVAIVSGDLARTLGAAERVDRFVPGADVVVVTIDLGIVVHDHGTHRFASHVLARRSWMQGPIVAAMNAQYIGRWDVAPRSHPNDGWLDVTEVDASMPITQRLLASRRLPTASHLPHPSISTRRVREAQWAFDRPVQLVADGVPLGRTTTLGVSIVPDALVVHV